MTTATFNRLDSVENPTDEQIEARERWVALLREGKYGKKMDALSDLSGALRCCLGVACDERVVAGFDVAGAHSNLSFDGEVSALPVRAQVALGIPARYPCVRIDAGVVSLDTLNDNEPYLHETNPSAPRWRAKGWSHAELADLIEAQYITPYKEA